MWPFSKSKEEQSFSPSVMGEGRAVLPSFSENVHPLKQRFDIEVDSWCFGLESLNDLPLPQVVFKVVRELRPLLKEAIEQGYAFDIRVLSEKLFFATKKTVPKKELTFALLAILPDPETLNIEQKTTFAVIVAQVEVTEGGAVERVRQRWNLGDRAIAKQRSATSLHPVRAENPR